MKRTAEYLAAVIPPVAGIGLAQINAALGTISLAIGIAYAIWKWRREASRPPQP